MRTTVCSLLIVAGFAAPIAFAPRAAAQDSKPGQPASANQPKTPPDAAESLPTVKEILSKYVKALGGEDAIRKHKSRTDKGTMSMMGREGKLLSYSAAPNKRVNVMVIPEGELKQSFDGEKGWDTGLGGERVLQGEALAERARLSDFYQPLNYERDYDVRVAGAETLDGKKVYKVGMTSKAQGDIPAGREQFVLFDAESGLIVGRIAERQMPEGPIRVQTRIGDYKPFDGVMIPTKTSTIFAGGQQTMTIESVEFDNVPDDVFAMPEQLKKTGSKPADPAAPAPK